MLARAAYSLARRRRSVPANASVALAVPSDLMVSCITTVPSAFFSDQAASIFTVKLKPKDGWSMLTTVTASW